MTILILFHHSHYRTFQAYSSEDVHRHLRSEFPSLVSYARCIDSTPLVVCHNARIHAQRVFAGRAARGKPSLGWFFGFKLHLVVNDQGQLLAFGLTPGNLDDRHAVPKLAKGLLGKLFGDQGSLCQPLAHHLRVPHGLQLITKLRKKMHTRLLDWSDKLLVRKRALIETITDQLKNICQIAHARHRSPINFLVNLMAGLIAYCHQPKKPSLGLQLPALPPP